MKNAQAPMYYNVRITPTRGGSSARGDEDPGCGPSPTRLRFDPAAILRAAVIGALAVLASDLGAAAAFGPPITARDVWADIIGGAAGGVAGEIADELGAGRAVVAIVAGFIGGFVAEALFPGAPIPPRSEGVPVQS